MPVEDVKRNNKIMNLWVADISLADIRSEMKVTTSVITNVVALYRRRGDPRAKIRSETKSITSDMIVEMYANGDTIHDISNKTGFKISAVMDRLRYNSELYRSRMKCQPKNFRVPKEEKDDNPVIHILPEDTRDTTGRICGDPLVGRRALDEYLSRRPQRDRLLPRITFLEEAA